MEVTLAGVVAFVCLAVACESGRGDSGHGGGGTPDQVDLGVGGGGQPTGGSGQQPAGGGGGGGDDGSSAAGSGGAGGLVAAGGSGGSGAGGLAGGGGGSGGTAGSDGGGGAASGGSGGAAGSGGGGGGAAGAGGEGGSATPVDCGAIRLNEHAQENGTFAFTGSTAAADNAFASACGGVRARDALFHFTAPEPGMWVFTTLLPNGGRHFGDILYALSDCRALESLVACGENWGYIVVKLAAGEGVYVVVDGYSDSSGDFTLRALRRSVLNIGDACEPFDIATTCEHNGLCADAEGDGTGSCADRIQIGGQCDWLNNLGQNSLCEEGSICVDAENDGTSNCTTPLVLPLGAECFSGSRYQVCEEGMICADTDGDFRQNCGRIVFVPEGHACDPWDPGYEFCEQGTSCMDPENNGWSTCVGPRLIPVGGWCDPAGDGVEATCDVGLSCLDPDQDDTWNCLVPVFTPIGAACVIAPCEPGVPCVDPDGDGTFICTEPVVLPVGAECELFSEYAFCAAPAVCGDPERSGVYHCLLPVAIPEGGPCVVGDRFTTCVEGIYCVDADAHGVGLCVVPGPERAPCPAEYGAVALLDPVVGAAPWSLDVDTTDEENRTGGTCGGDAAPEAIVEFVAPADAEYIARTAGEARDTVLYVRRYCGLAEPEATCNDDTVFGRVFTSEIRVTLAAGEHAYFFVDGFDLDAGPVTLIVAPAPH